MNKRSQVTQDLFATLAVVQRMMHACLQRSFEEIDVAPSQLQLLHHIMQQQPVSLKILAADMRLTPGAITQLVEGVVHAGYVTRSESSEDRRITVVSLTDAGMSVVKRLEQKKRVLLKGVVANLDDNELAVFLRVQHKMLTYLETYCSKLKK